jgi:hypothetical protein
MSRETTERLEQSLLLHLLEHRGAQVRFEADQWTTEFGIFRKFADDNQGEVKTALRSLEMTRMIYRRVQYVVGYSEPKLVYSLTPGGHRKALDLAHQNGGSHGSAMSEAPPPENEVPAPLPSHSKK